jgi:hypothetical protein
MVKARQPISGNAGHRNDRKWEDLTLTPCLTWWKMQVRQRRRKEAQGDASALPIAGMVM